MSDNELEEYLKTVEPNFDSHIEKGTIEMSNEYYNLLEERISRLLNENKQLKEDKKKVWDWVIYKQQHSIEPVISTDELDDILEILGDKE